MAFIEAMSNEFNCIRKFYGFYVYNRLFSIFMNPEIIALVEIFMI